MNNEKELLDIIIGLTTRLNNLETDYNNKMRDMQEKIEKLEKLEKEKYENLNKNNEIYNINDEVVEDHMFRSCNLSSFTFKVPDNAPVIERQNAFYSNIVYQN